jgi:hypothetical protein
VIFLLQLDSCRFSCDYKASIGSMWWCGWLRHCSTRQKVAGSIPDGGTGIFYSHNPSGCTMALVSTKPLTAMGTRNISWEAQEPVLGADNLTTLPPSCADCIEIWEPQPPETLWAHNTE